MILVGDKKRGQVTIFIIIAIVLVAGILVYSFAIKPNFGGKNSPSLGFENCVSKALNEKIITLAETGGYTGEYASYNYLRTEVPYFCYTGKNLELCTVQNPFPVTSFENKLSSEVIPQVRRCYDSSLLSLKLQGYEVVAGDIDVNLSINPNAVDIGVKAPTNIEGAVFEEFSYSFSSNIYDVLLLATEILDAEVNYGEVDILDYVYTYPNLVVQRLIQDDFSVIYIIEDKNSEIKYQFAVRNLVFPPGYTA